MKRLQAFYFELMPNGENKRAMCKFSGCCRFVYNKALVLQKESYEAGNKYINYLSMAKMLASGVIYPLWGFVMDTWMQLAKNLTLSKHHNLNFGFIPLILRNLSFSFCTFCLSKGFCPYLRQKSIVDSI